MCVKRFTIGVLADTASGFANDAMGFLGGAEYSQATLLAERPHDIDIIYCPPDKKPAVANYDAFLIFNCTRYDHRWIEVLRGKPFAMRIADWWRYGDPVLRRFILNDAKLLFFSSVMHKERFDYTWLPMGGIDNHVIKILPPPLKLQPFFNARASENVRENRALWAGRICPPKGLQRSIDCTLVHGVPLDVYGFKHATGFDMNKLQEMTVTQARLALGDFLGDLDDEEFADIPLVTYQGVYQYKDAPQIFAQYQYFLFHPFWNEPFGRTVVEAYTSGCTMVCDWSKIGCKDILFREGPRDSIPHGFARPAKIIEEMNDVPNKFWQHFREKTL